MVLNLVYYISSAKTSEKIFFYYSKLIKKTFFHNPRNNSVLKRLSITAVETLLSEDQ